MLRDDLPRGQQAITFRWGTPGDGPTFKDGMGFSHIIAKHGPEVVEDIIDTIAHGSDLVFDTSRATSRVEIRHNNHIVKLALDHDGTRETWVLSGYKDARGANRHFNLRELSSPMFFKGGTKGAPR